MGATEGFERGSKGGAARRSAGRGGRAGRGAAGRGRAGRGGGGGGGAPALLAADWLSTAMYLSSFRMFDGPMLIVRVAPSVPSAPPCCCPPGSEPARLIERLSRLSGSS